MNIHIKSIVSAFAFSLLFYSQSFGLNLFLISLLVVVLVSTLKKGPSISWVYSLIYISSAIFVFFNPSGFTVFVHFMTFMVFVGKSISQKTALYLSWFMGLINMLTASVANFNNHKNQDPEEKKNLSPKTFNHIKGIVVALGLLLIFGFLYKNANPVFGNLIEQIDLSFISIPWLFFTLLGYVLFLHLLRPYHSKELIELDQAYGNDLKRPEVPFNIATTKKLAGEHTLGSIVFIALNLLLVFFLTTDIIYLFQENDISNAGYSASVHQGVYALMFSIICAIALILYFFRGNLNFFDGNKRLKSLTYVWIGLNVLLVVFTCYKNYAYVTALGLTYKRIGVFVYLLLTLTGLITAYIKVSEIKNFVYLVRTNLALLFTFLFISAAFPWDKLITAYNLDNITKVDIRYLIDLSDSNSEQLYHYAQDHEQSLSLNAMASIKEKYHDFSLIQSEKTWQEYTFYQLVNNTIK